MQAAHTLHKKNLNRLLFKFLPSLFDFIGLNYSVIDKEGNYIVQNNSVINQISKGLRNAEIIDKNTWEDCKRVMNTGKREIKEEAFKEKFYFSIKQPIMNDNKNCSGIIVLGLDITELKNTQKALESAYQAKTQLISTAAHEIRGPVTNFIHVLRMQESKIGELKEFFYAEVLGHVAADKREALIEKFQEEYVKLYELSEMAAREAKRALRSLSDLAALHTLQLEGVKYSLSSIDPLSLIQLAREESNYPNDRHIEFRVKIDEKLPHFVRIDVLNITDALSVIIGNAIRFSHAHGIVRINVEKAEDQKIRIIVEDLGQGMTENQVKMIFNAGFDKDMLPEERRYQKPSLQLPQVKMRVEASGGRIDIHSNYQLGTKVILTLPYEESSENKNKTPVSDIPLQHFLLVEDDHFTQKVTKFLIEEAGHKVDTGSTAEEALSLARNTAYDAIFLDITLPDKNGLHVLREISKHEKAPFVVILTSHDSEVDVEYFLSQGATHVISKPVTAEILQDCIETLYKIQKGAEHK